MIVPSELFHRFFLLLSNKSTLRLPADSTCCKTAHTSQLTTQSTRNFSLEVICSSQDLESEPTSLRIRRHVYEIFDKTIGRILLNNLKQIDPIHTLRLAYNGNPNLFHWSACEWFYRIEKSWFSVHLLNSHAFQRVFTLFAIEKYQLAIQ